MNGTNSSNAKTVLWVTTWHPGPRWVRALDWALMWACALTGHQRACWLLNTWSVGRWVVSHASTVTREEVR